MTDDELVEKVALDALCVGCRETPTHPCKVVCIDCRIEARAAIAVLRPLVLEEAAKVCEKIEDEQWIKWRQEADPIVQGASCGALWCAEDIRALKGNK